MMHVRESRFVVLGMVLLMLGVSFAQRGAIQVVGDPDLVIRVDGEIVGLVSNEPGGLLITDVRVGDRLVEALDAGEVILTEVVSVEQGEVSVFEAVNRWPHQFEASNADWIAGLVVGNAGTTYVAGSTWVLFGRENAGPAGFVRALDRDGRELWTQQIGTSGGDNVWGVAVDDAGVIYAAGSTWGSLGGENQGKSDGFVRALDRDGRELWTQQIGTSEGDGVSDVAVDDAGVLYVAGSTEGSLGGPTVGERDGFVRALDRDGRELWTQQFGTSEWDVVHGVSVDDAGGIYVAGITSGSLDGENSGGSRIFVNRLLPSE